MDHQRLGITDIGQMRNHRQRLDKAATGGAGVIIGTGLDTEADHRACALRQQLIGQCVIGMLRHGRVPDPGNALLIRHGLFQEGQHCGGIFLMSLHTDRQGFDALQQGKGSMRVERRTDITQPLGAQLHAECLRAELFPEIEAVIAGIWLGNRWELATGTPVEGTAIDNSPTHGNAVPAHPFGQ